MENKMKFTKYDTADYLRTKEDMASYLQAVLEEKNVKHLIKAIGNIARANSMNKIAQDIGVSRESLYKSLNGETKVSFDTIYNILNSLELKLAIVPEV